MNAVSTQRVNIPYLTRFCCDSSDGLRAGRPVTDSRQGKDLTFLSSAHIDSGDQTASYPMDTECYFPGIKRKGREPDHSHPTNDEVKNVGAICVFIYKFHGMVLN